MTVWQLAAFVGGAVFLVLCAGYALLVLAAQTWPHDTSRHTGWEDDARE